MLSHNYHTGSAATHTVLKTSSEVVLQGVHFDPCRSNNREAIELKFGDSDYVWRPTNSAKFGKNRIGGGGPTRG